jgi:flavodoxin
MKTLIVFYSRTGTTKKAVEILAKEMNADVEEITDKIDRKGVIGYLKSGRDGMKRRLTEIDPTKKDPQQYDMIIIGTPMWATNMCSPIRTYLTKNKIENKKIGILITHGGSSAEKIVKEIGELTQKSELTGHTAIKTREIKYAENKIKEWLKSLKL